MPYEPVLLARIHKPDSGKLEGYRADGGYATFERALKHMNHADALIQELKLK
jgi:NADH-quinone oxidoreductase subunit F